MRNAGKWLIRRITKAPALCSTRRGPSNFLIGTPCVPTLSGLPSRAVRGQAAAQPGPEPRGPARSAASTGSMARTCRLDAGKRDGTCHLPTIIVESREFDYILRSGGEAFAPPPFLEHELDPDSEQPAAPGPFHVQGNRQWQEPHRDYLRIVGEADATVEGACLPRLSRWFGTAAFAGDSATLASRRLIRPERVATARTKPPALCSTRRRPSNSLIGTPCVPTPSGWPSRAVRGQAAARPGPEPRGPARSAASTGSMARTCRLDAGKRGGTWLSSFRALELPDLVLERRSVRVLSWRVPS